MERFNKVAHKWDEKPRRILMGKAVSSAMLKAVDFSGKSALEIGSGTGLVGLPVAEKAKSVLGIDTSLEMTKVFNQKVEELEISNAKAEVKDLFKDELPKVDAIFSSMVFHHIENTREALIRCYELLNEDGKILIADLNTEDGSFHGENSEGIYHNGFCRKFFENLLQKVGFKNISIKTVHEIEKNEKSYKIFLAVASKG